MSKHGASGKLNVHVLTNQGETQRVFYNQSRLMETVQA